MVVRSGIGHGEANGDVVEKRWLGYNQSGVCEVVSDMKHQFIGTDVQGVVFQQRAAGSPVRIAGVSRQQQVGRIHVIQLNRDAACRAAMRRIEDMRGDFTHCDQAFFRAKF